MALQKCHECGNNVSTEATTCPTCGAPVNQQPPTEQPKPKKRRSRKGCVVVGVFVIFVLSCIGVFTGEEARERFSNPPAASSDTDREPEPPRTWRDEDASIHAFAMMRNHVRDRLRSPSTASFPGVGSRDAQVQHLGEQVYRVRSYVDAQNAFGATVRTHFVGDIEQVEENTWRLRELEMLE